MAEKPSTDTGKPRTGAAGSASQVGAKVGTELIPNLAPRKIGSGNKALNKSSTRSDIPRRPTEQKQASGSGSSRPYPESKGKQLIVGQDITLNGEIKDCESLIVEGSVEAALVGSDTLIITQNGTFKGPADVREADISGLFDGSLTVHGRLSIRYGGRVVGKVRYGELLVEAGGELVGDLDQLDG